MRTPFHSMFSPLARQSQAVQRPNGSVKVARKAALALTIIASASFALPDSAKAQELPAPTCAWPFEWTAYGLGNWLFPDTGNRWWYMPVNSRWQSVEIKGAFPSARFFSYAMYDGAPVSSGLADHLFDTQLMADANMINPFNQMASTARGQSYTVTVRRTGGGDGNVLRLNAKTGWLVYRLYLPNGGEGSMGGTPLPSVIVTDADGQAVRLPPCDSVNRQSELASLQPLFVPPMLETPPKTPRVPDRVWFGPLPNPPARLLPNPDNKYMVSFFMTEREPGRVLVVRGKMPAFPDTYNGAPISQPAPGFDKIEMRYWSMCLGNLVSPLPITGCAVDATSPLDEEKFYTLVVSDDVLKPAWLPSGSTWIPWGDEQMFPKTLFLRNTLPSSDFKQSVQAAITGGCGVEFNFPTPPAQEAIRQAGECTQKVMGDYYPIAVWCDRQILVEGGWKACFKQAGVH